LKITDPIEITSIESFEKNKPDDFFICCGSPESRCIGAIKKFSPSYKPKIVLLLKYTNHISQKREENIKKMKDKLEKVTKIVEISLDEENPIPMINNIIENIDQYSNNIKPTITLDISTIIKWHLLIFLKALEMKRFFEKIRILYTEPKDYITDLFQPLSFGINQIFPIPTFSRDYDFSKQILLILILGYEGNRALALLEDMDPTESLLLIARPAYHKEWEGRTEQMNSEIINIVGKSKIKYIDSRNPVLISRQLFDILSNPQYSNYNHIISPLGTKPQTLGLYLYVSSKRNNATLIYGSPSRHNEPFYSHGIGRSWILPFYKIN